MAVLDGCESKYRTPVPEERTCPKCGKIVEVFTVRGRIMEDAKGPCGEKRRRIKMLLRTKPAAA